MEAVPGGLMSNAGKSKAELKQLAVDISDGRVFTSFQVRNDIDLPTVFMPLVFLTEKQYEEMGEIYMIYEYEGKELQGRYINGMPIFFSMNILNKEDTEYVMEEVQKLNEFKKAYMEDETL
jgi:hypothetical protein